MAKDKTVHFHGWDSTGWFGHEIDRNKPDVSILRKLRKAPAGFQTRFNCCSRDFPEFTFQTTVYDLADSGLGIVNLSGVSAPLAALTVLPGCRRPRLREEYAFGLVAHLSFLGGLIGPESELATHDYIEAALRSEPDSTLVFTVESARARGDLSIVLPEYLERLAMAMLAWLGEKDAERKPLEGGAQARRPVDSGLEATA